MTDEQLTPHRRKHYQYEYEKMRRQRYAFHSPNQKLHAELLEKYRAEFEGHPDRLKKPSERYRKYLAHIDAENAKIRDHLKTQEAMQRNDKPFQASVQRLGGKQALRKHGYLNTAPLSRQFKKEPSEKVFARDYDHLASLEAFIKGLFNRRLRSFEDEPVYTNPDQCAQSVNDWVFGDNSYSELEQYNRKVVQICIGRGGTKAQRTEKAYKAFLAYLLEIRELWQYFQIHMHGCGLKDQKNAYLPIAKMLIGEFVSVGDKPRKKFSKSDPTSDLAKVLKYFEDHSVTPQDIKALFNKIGGPTGILKRS